MLLDAALSLSQRPSRNASKQLRSLERRATPQLQETHSHSQPTRPICYQVTIIIVAVYHRISATSQLRSLERQRHAAASAPYMTVTPPPIHESGSYRMPRLHCRGVRYDLRPNKPRPFGPRTTLRLLQRSSPLAYIPHKILTHENVMMSNVTSSLPQRPSRRVASNCALSNHERRYDCGNAPPSLT